METQETSKLTTSKQFIFDRWRSIEILWRLSNLAIFLLAHLGPWGTFFSEIIYGFEVPDLTLSVFTGIFEAESSLELETALGFNYMWGMGYGFGWTMLTIYWIINLVRTFNSHKRWGQFRFHIPLLLASFFTFYSSYIAIRWDPLSRFWWWWVSWGKWLLLLSIISSLVLEVIVFASNTNRNLSSPKKGEDQALLLSTQNH